MKPICVIGLGVLAGIGILLIPGATVYLQLLPHYFWTGVGAVFAIIFILSITAGSNAQGLSKDFPLQFRLAAQFRTPVLMFIVIPLSFLLWVHAKVRDRVRLYFLDNSIKAHLVRVERIKKQVKGWNDSGRKSILRTARPNWASMSTKLNSNKGECHKIMTHDLTSIIHVDYEAMTVTAEPAVNMGQITHFLVPKGYALLIQVEMESLTIGGLSMGFGMETNSHIVGFFQESIVSYELVTADGEAIHVTAKSDPELFYALPWSCGTIGFLTSVTVKIVKTKPYMHVTYLPTYSTEEFASKLKELSESPNAPPFLEATIYSLDTAVIQYAEFSDAPQDRSKINAVNWWWKPYYYKWVETFIKKGQSDEYIPLMDYYHRFTRSIFWEIEEMIPFSNHWLYRTFWGWMGAPEVSLLKLFQGPAIRKASVEAHVVQESIMPVGTVLDGVRKYDQWYGVYPLLVFPLRVYDRGELSGFLNPRKRNLVKGTNWGIWVDIGAYGTPRQVKLGKPWSAKKNVRAMESWTREVGGFQAYYTDLFCTEREFRIMFDHSLLDKCRKRMNALDAFPEVYDKIKPEAGIVDLVDELAKEERENTIYRRPQITKSTPLTNGTSSSTSNGHGNGTSNGNGHTKTRGKTSTPRK